MSAPHRSLLRIASWAKADCSGFGWLSPWRSWEKLLKTDIHWASVSSFGTLNALCSLKSGFRGYSIIALQSCWHYYELFGAFHCLIFRAVSCHLYHPTPLVNSVIL